MATAAEVCLSLPRNTTFVAAAIWHARGTHCRRRRARALAVRPFLLTAAARLEARLALSFGNLRQFVRWECEFVLAVYFVRQRFRSRNQCVCPRKVVMEGLKQRLSVNLESHSTSVEPAFVFASKGVPPAFLVLRSWGWVRSDCRCR